MKKLFGILFMILLFAGMAQAADITLKWDAQTDATGFKIYRSLDSGVTWEVVQTVGAVTQVTLNGQPDTGLVMFRAAATNASGEEIRYEAGVWYNGSWKPPADPTGTGIQ